MNWWQPHNFEKRREHLNMRAQIIKATRRYFEGQNFDEVQTPVLQIMASPDTHIHAFETTRLGHNLKPIQSLGLHTSPEIAMKKLLVAGMERIYQICPVFRNAEDSSLHSPEFTMLEWYRTDTDYTAMMNDCESLVKSLGIPKFKTCDVVGEWERLSVANAFQKYANTDLNTDLKESAQSIGVRVIESDTFEDIFHAIMAEKIEPYLGHDKPTILYDYPVCMASLARKAKDPRYAERFELYICGVELANAFSELTDATEQRARLEADMAQKKAIYDIDAPIDEDFLKALEYGMPESSGCALGLDRLIMLASGADDIDDVLWAGKP